MPHINIISKFSFLWILLRHNIIINLTTEIAMIAQHRLCHRSTQSRIYPTHEHRRLTKGFVYPLAKCTISVVKGIPDPQTVREWCAIITASKESTIRGAGKGCIYFGLYIGGMITRGVVGVFNVSETCIKLVAFGHTVCGAASRKHTQHRESYNMRKAVFIHLLFVFNAVGTGFNK